MLSLHEKWDYDADIGIWQDDVAKCEELARAAAQVNRLRHSAKSSAPWPVLADSANAALLSLRRAGMSRKRALYGSKLLKADSSACNTAKSITFMSTSFPFTRRMAS